MNKPIFRSPYADIYRATSWYVGRCQFFFQLGFGLFLQRRSVLWQQESHFFFVGLKVKTLNVLSSWLHRCSDIRYMNLQKYKVFTSSRQTTTAKQIIKIKDFMIFFCCCQKVRRNSTNCLHSVHFVLKTKMNS